MATFFFSESSLGNSLHFYLAAKNKGLKRRNYLDNRFTPHHEFEPKSSLPESQVNLESLKISPLFLLLSFFYYFRFDICVNLIMVSGIQEHLLLSLNVTAVCKGLFCTDSQLRSKEVNIPKMWGADIIPL